MTEIEKYEQEIEILKSKLYEGITIPKFEEGIVTPFGVFTTEFYSQPHRKETLVLRLSNCFISAPEWELTYIKTNTQSAFERVYMFMLKKLVLCYPKQNN